MPPLFRYFSEINACAFLEKGEVLFRSLSYFRDYEDAGVRADAHEGTLVHLPADGLSVTKVNSGEVVTLPHRFGSTVKEDQIFVYCMSTELSEQIADRFKSKVIVEIFEQTQFLARLRSSLSLRKRLRTNKLVHNEVKYYEWHEPPIVDWALPEKIAMSKLNFYAPQHEYRIAFSINDAFRVENTSLRLVPPGNRKLPRTNFHPEKLLKIGNLSKSCTVHRFA